MSDANKTSGVPKPEREADWVIDLDKLAAETGTPPQMSIAPVPVTGHSQPAPTLEGMTGTEFFRLASDAATASDHSPSEVSASQQYQDIQQQNEQLMDWVSELEESLSQCQTALQFQRQRCQELETLLTQRQKAESTSSLEAHFNRSLQESQQQVQKQQILVDTLTQQLDNTKERVSVLEQEYGGLQKRFADQTQRLVQSENECRSLKTRLSRQQRYTLQFKAALERCLEVSVPLPADTEAPQEETAMGSPTAPALPEPVTFFPRSSPVQPWSAAAGESDEDPSEGTWQKVAQWVESSVVDPQDSLTPNEISEPISDADPPLEAIDEPSFASERLESADLVLDPAEVSGTIAPDVPSDLDDREITESLLADPVAEMEGDNHFAESVTDQFSPPDAAPSSSEIAPPISLPTVVEPLNLDVALKAVIQNQPQLAVFNSSLESTTSTESKDAAAAVSGASAGQAYELWQSLAQDKDPDLDSATSAPEELAPEESVSPAATAESLPASPSLDLKVLSFPAQKPSFNLNRSEQPAVAAASGSEEQEQVRKKLSNPLLGNPPSLNLQPSWPSPLVYPLRPPKKRGSLAAIELPRFPQR